MFLNFSTYCILLTAYCHRAIMKEYLNPKRFTREEVLSKRPELQEVFEQNNVLLACLFGSVLQDKFTLLSDLDMAVLIEPISYDWLNSYSDIYEGVCKILGGDNVDIVPLNEASPSLKFKVVKSGLLIYAKDKGSKIEFEEKTLLEFHDGEAIRKEGWNYLCRYIRGENKLIDRERVERLLWAMREALSGLSELDLRSKGLDGYLEDRVAKALSEHWVRKAIEAALDLGRHIIASEELGIPETYKDIGRILGEKGVISAELARKLMGFAGLRNILVHLYWDIDYTRLYEMASSEIFALEEYARYILLRLG